MVANLMGDLAKIEHQQKLQRIESGIRAAQEVGKWTGRPLRGFETNEEGYLHVVPEEFLHTREALARVERGESRRSVAEETGIPLSSLRRLYDNRRELYLAGKMMTSESRRLSTNYLILRIFVNWRRETSNSESAKSLPMNSRKIRSNDSAESAKVAVGGRQRY